MDLDDKKAGEEVEGYWNNYKGTTISKYYLLWKEFYEKYQSYLDPAKARSRENNLFVPRCYDSVETAVPRLLMALFSVNPPFQCKPREAGDIAAAEALTQVLTYYNDSSNFFGLIAQALKNAAIFGTAIIKSGWDTTEHKPIRYLVGLPDFFIDPRVQRIEDAEYCGDRKIRTLSYLREMEAKGVYKNVDTVEKAGIRYSSGSNEFLRAAKSIHKLPDPFSFNNGGNKNDKNPNIEVIECYKDYGRTIVTIAGGITIRNEPNPFPGFPYCPIIPTPDVVEFYGIGLIEPIRFQQDELNDLHNARMDYIMRSINAIILTGMSEWENSNSWNFKMGAKWRVNDANQVKPLDMKPLPPEAFGMSSEISNGMDRTNALSDYVRGTNTTGKESATGAALLAQAADTRLKLQLYNVQNDLKRLINFDIKNMQKFLPDNIIIRITNKPVIIPRNNIQLEYDVSASGIADLTSKETKRAQGVNLLNVLLGSGIPQMVALEGNKLSITGIVQQILETFEFKNMQEIITPIQQQPMASMGAPGMVPPTNMPTDMGGVMKEVAESKAPQQTLPMAPMPGGR